MNLPAPVLTYSLLRSVQRASRVMLTVGGGAVP